MKNKLSGSTAAKFTAFVLAAAIFTALFGFGLCYIWAASDSGYRQSGSFDDSDLAHAAATRILGDAYWGSFSSAAEERRELEELDRRLSGTNLRYSLKSKYSENSVTHGREPTDVLLFTTGELNGRTWSIYRSAELTAHDMLYDSFRFYQAAQQALRLWPLFLVLLLTELALLAFLACASARKSGQEEFVTGWQERIPFDLYCLLNCSLAGLLAIPAVVGFDDLRLYPFSSAGLNLMAVTCALIAVPLLAGWMTLCARIKTHTLWKSCLCRKLLLLVWRAVRWLFELCGKVWRFLLSLAKAIPLLWRVIAVSGAYFLVLLIAAAEYEAELIMLLCALGFLAVLYFALMLLRLRKGIAAISRGEEELSIDTKCMLPAFRESAAELGSIRNGITLAVEAQLRSERMKTELITNVSHDIKTPLTSLVSYVDLLQREEDEEKRREYLDVLQRQSLRLKKLTEDLVELSKSGSGAMSCTLSRRSVRELLQQAVGEYGEKLELAGLTCILSLPEEELFCLADGNLTWRVLDNLLGNACKYAQSGTRLYVSVSAEAEYVSIEVKNISREALNMDPTELMERFKRGDASRSTEGSGLGLSIADNLARLQGGSLQLTIDGDLFKVCYRLRRSK
ncbi:MAG: HAMP domain-containing histidine kinase [Oscillospiraceae bacterium]|nr:HAMP domain-containing histidine kinase [Oscillospiraceae bacterium]